MSIWLLILRFAHIVAGAFWGGGALLMEFFVGRTIISTGDAGKEFSFYLMNKLKLHRFMTGAAISTILAGGFLYWHDTNGFTSPWMYSSTGISFGIGAVFGLAAFISGAMFGSSNAALAELGSQIQGKPSDEQLKRIEQLQKRIKTVSPIHITSMILALSIMATARYIAF